MNLKTLKDISKGYVEGMNDKSLIEIKEEAIKWVKKYRKQGEPLKRKSWFEGACYSLMQFHNITEEDLK